MKYLILALVSTMALNAQALEIDANSFAVPKLVLEKAAQAISAQCSDVPAVKLEIINVEVTEKEIDQGQTDTTYVLDIEIPNNTNDDDEDLIVVTVLDAAISNPAIENPTAEGLKAYGWINCKDF